MEVQRREEKESFILRFFLDSSTLYIPVIKISRVSFLQLSKAKEFLREPQGPDHIWGHFLKDAQKKALGGSSKPHSRACSGAGRHAVVRSSSCAAGWCLGVGAVSHATTEKWYWMYLHLVPLKCSTELKGTQKKDCPYIWPPPQQRKHRLTGELRGVINNPMFFQEAILDSWEMSL